MSETESKIQKVTIEYSDKIVTIEGSEAEKWQSHCESVVGLAYAHGCNPFDTDKIAWKETKKQEPERLP